MSKAEKEISTVYAYVGSRTSKERNARGEGISVYKVHAENGNLDRVQLMTDLVNPSFLALNKKQDRLYTVHGDGHEVSVFCIDPNLGTLRFLQRQECGGLNPVHLALDPSERFLIVSDHLGQKNGTVAVMPVDSDGRLGPVHQRVSMAGQPGPHRKEQPHAKPHFNPFDPSGRFVLVPDKGLDRVFVFRFENGHLTPADVPWMGTREGAGPRHVAFHPEGHFAYVINELDSTIIACRFDPDTGQLRPFQIVSTLPDDFIGTSRASEIEIAANGRTLYASNRGFDSITSFDIDQQTGRMSFVDAIDSNGKTPRFFKLSPAGRFMYVLNEDSDSIELFAVDNAGRLFTAHQTLTCGSPVCIVFMTHTCLDSVSGFSGVG